MLKKVLVSLVIAATLLGSAIGLLPQGNVAQADFTVTSAVLTATTPILPAQNYTFNAGGFADGEVVEYLIGNVRLGRVTSNGDGVSTATVKIPTDLVKGSYTLKAQNADGTSVATATATLNPGLTVSSASGSAGSSVTVQGFAFTAAETYAITFTNGYSSGHINCVEPGSTVSASLATGTASRIGSLSKDVTIPSVSAGSYRIVARGAASGVCAVY